MRFLQNTIFKVEWQIHIIIRSSYSFHVAALQNPRGC